MPTRLLIGVASLGGFLIASSTSVPGSEVRGLALPTGFTVDPESATRAIGRSANGVVVALASPTDGSSRARAFRWSPGGERTSFAPLSVRTNSGTNQAASLYADAVAAAPNGQYVTVASPFAGAYSGVSTEAEFWMSSGASRWRIPACVASGYAKDQKVYGTDGAGRVALTMDMTGVGSFEAGQDDFSQYAPYAFVIDGTSCRRLGRAIVLDVSGAWASGYRGYLDGRLAPTNRGGSDDHPVAVRWHGAKLTELGKGDALAVTSNGFAVGATAVPGTAETPQAVAWDREGRQLVIDSRDVPSVAYDVANVAGAATVVGMTSADGRHYAFRWRAGRFERLDDLPHPSGWRFESAFAIAGDGTIVGIGTLRGIPTVFVWRS